MSEEGLDLGGAETGDIPSAIEDAPAVDAGTADPRQTAQPPTGANAQEQGALPSGTTTAENYGQEFDVQPEGAQEGGTENTAEGGEASPTGSFNDFNQLGEHFAAHGMTAAQVYELAKAGYGAQSPAPAAEGGPKESTTPAAQAGTPEQTQDSQASAAEADADLLAGLNLDSEDFVDPKALATFGKNLLGAIDGRLKKGLDSFGKEFETKQEKRASEQRAQQERQQHMQLMQHHPTANAAQRDALARTAHGIYGNGDSMTLAQAYEQASKELGFGAKKGAAQGVPKADQNKVIADLRRAATITAASGGTNGTSPSTHTSAPNTGGRTGSAFEIPGDPQKEPEVFRENIREALQVR